MFIYVPANPSDLIYGFWARARPVQAKSAAGEAIKAFLPTSVIGSAGFGWSGESCFFEGDTGAAVWTGVAKPFGRKNWNANI